MDYHARMLCPNFVFPRMVALAIAACATSLVCHSALAQTRSPSKAPAATNAAVSDAPSAAIHNSALDAQLFYQILVGEMSGLAGINGAEDKGQTIILDAARKTDDARLYARAVDLAIQSRSGEAALQAARAWRLAQPQSREANAQLLQVLLALNRLNETLLPLRSSIQLTPESARTQTIEQIPRLYANISDKKAAVQLIEKALAEYLGNSATQAASWVAVGRMRLAAQDIRGAAAAAEQAHRADPRASAVAFFALQLMQAQHANAESIVQSYLQDAAALPEIRLGYIRALLDAQRVGEARTQAQQLTREKPDLAQAWLIQGSLDLQDKRYDQALLAYQRYIELMAPQAPSQEKEYALAQAYLALSQIAENKKDFSLAKAWLEKIDTPFALVGTQTRRASILAREGKMREARELIANLPERPGEAGDADRQAKILAQVQLLRDNQQYQAAYDFLQEAVLTQPENDELIYQQASMAEKLSNYDDMERLLRRVIALKPNYSYAYNFLGYSLADRNLRLPEAKALLEKALALAPGDPAITDSMGWVEFRLGHYESALRLLEQAYKKLPNAEVGAHLGEVLWTMGQRERAIAIWQECLLMDKNDEVLTQTLKRLRVSL